MKKSSLAAKLIALGACVLLSAAPVYAKGKSSVRFIMHFVDPASSPYVEGGKKIAELVKEKTDGQITIDVLSDGELGGEWDTLEMAVEGKLDIATCANSVLTNYIPQMNVLDQAFLWNNADEAHAAIDGTLGDLIRERALSLGLHIIGFEESGFRNTFSTKPITSIEDFQGVTIRTLENKYHQAAFASFGATPVAMPYTEVNAALEDGTIDACENALRSRTQLRFKYYDLDFRCEHCYRYDKETITVEPYALVCFEDNYYLHALRTDIADEAEALRIYRLDRMEKAEKLSAPISQRAIARVEKPAEYTRSAFKMFNGEEVTVTLRFPKELCGPVFDKFGEKITITQLSDDLGELTETVRISGTFFGWVDQFEGKMQIVAPESVCRQHREHLQKLLERY